MKKAWIVCYGVFVIVFGSAVVLKASFADKPDILAIGNFAILSLTLITLFWYAFDTNAIARVTSKRWRREAVLGTTYDVVLAEGNRGDAGRTSTDGLGYHI